MSANEATEKFIEPPDQRSSVPAPSGSASDYNPAQCLREEVERFKETNRFTPMDVTGFYIQAAVVLDEHRRMVEALREIRDTRYNSSSHQLMKNIAARALPMSEKATTPNDLHHRPRTGAEEKH